jgi:hypothetical protein
VIAIAVDLLIKVVVELVSIKADVPDVVCALIEQLPTPAIKIEMNKMLNFIYFGWRLGSASHASRALVPILPSIGHGVPAMIMASYTRRS